MGDTLQGHGLFTASDRLAELASDSAQLARARRRFSDSPPSYRSQPSGTTTRSQSFNPPTEEQYNYDRQVCELTLEYRASRPREQWSDETFEEGHRMVQERVEEGTFVYVRDCTNLPPVEFLRWPREAVKKRWVEQGIWNDNWEPEMPTGLWKHEEPLRLEPDSDSISDPETQARSLFSGPARPKAPKNEEELQRLADRQIVREREREASRPIHRFVYQVSAERDQIRSKAEVAEPDALDPADINTQAYNIVKDNWVKRGMWYHGWGMLPGMNWKHEKDFSELRLEELGPRPDSDPAQDDSERREMKLSPGRLFRAFSTMEPPAPDLPDELQGPSPILERSKPQDSDVDQRRQGPDQSSRRTGSESTEHEPASAAAESPRRGNKAQPRRGGRGRRAAGTDRGPVNPAAKVNKLQPKKAKAKPKRRGKNAPSVEPLEPQPPQTTLDIPEQPMTYTPETPRRSRRIQTRSATKRSN
ncbi:hypothetical protein PG991_010676 [Apiospora marii]|uniref:Uncharacterized protein n=1 Tax=Apiospora marii TaxID=335849 RepID=A0ABR1RCA1_9PEZI